MTQGSLFGNKSFRLLHLSDLHWSSPKFRLGLILSKKILGHSNIVRNKKKRLKNPDKISILLDFLKEDNWDVLCLSGDLSHLSEKDEFEQSLRRLTEIKHGRPIFLIPGNHDRYTANTLRKRKFEEIFGALSEVDLNLFTEKKYFHALLSDTCALSCFETTRPTGPVSSSGRHHGKGFEDSDFFPGFDLRGKSGLTKIAMGHYNLSTASTSLTQGKSHRLIDTAGFLKKLRDASYSYYLHGHIHESWEHDEGGNLTSINSAGWDKPAAEGGGIHRLNVTAGGEVQVEGIHLF